MSHERWNREELYDLVWSKPFTELAKEFAISDVGLRKTCVKLEVPVPKAGHWAKVRNGKEVTRPRLPPSTRNLSAFKPFKRTAPIDVAKPAEPIMLDEAKTAAYREALTFESNPDNAIVVRSGIPHSPVGEKTLKALQKRSKPDLTIPALSEGVFDLRVSADAAERAVSICEGLVLALERRGWKLELGSKNAAQRMCIELFGFKLPFWIEEILERRNHILSPEEKKDQLKNPWKYSQPTYDRIPTGRLILRLGERDTYRNPGYRVRWADGKKKRIESEVVDFCKELVLAAIRKRNDQIESENRKRQWEEEEKRRKEQEYLRSLDERRVKNLRSELDQYDLMIRTRRYVAYVRECIAASGAKIEDDLAAWLEWAERFAQRCDPLREGFPKYEVRNELDQRYHATGSSS